MSTAAATMAAPPAKKRLPKIAIALGAAFVVAAAGGAGAYYWINANAESADEAEEVVRTKRKEAPAFLALDVFTVNLADKDADRFLQVGVSFELANAKAAEEVKQYVPAVRNAILMVLATQESKGLLERAGKEKLADELRLASLKAMGYSVEEPDADDEDAPAKKKKRKKTATASQLAAVRQVHFSSFLIN